MKKFLTIIAFLMTSMSFSQDTITADQARNFIGKEVILKGRISSVRLASEGKSTNLINIDRGYPNQIFTVVVSNQYIEERKLDLESSKGKFIVVKGTVSTYEKDPKKIPQISNPVTFVIN